MQMEVFCALGNKTQTGRTVPDLSNSIMMMMIIIIKPDHLSLETQSIQPFFLSCCCLVLKHKPLIMLDWGKLNFFLKDRVTERGRRRSSVHHFTGINVYNRLMSGSRRNQALETSSKRFKLIEPSLCLPGSLTGT